MKSIGIGYLKAKADRIGWSCETWWEHFNYCISFVGRSFAGVEGTVDIQPLCGTERGCHQVHTTNTTTSRNPITVGAYVMS